MTEGYTAAETQSSQTITVADDSRPQTGIARYAKTRTLLHEAKATASKEGWSSQLEPATNPTHRHAGQVRSKLLKTHATVGPKASGVDPQRRGLALRHGAEPRPQLTPTCKVSGGGQGYPNGN